MITGSNFSKSQPINGHGIIAGLDAHKDQKKSFQQDHPFIHQLKIFL